MRRLAIVTLFVAAMGGAVWYAVRFFPRRATSQRDVEQLPVQSPQTPSADDSTPEVALPVLGPSCGGHCGTERWSVKTLSDPDRDLVSLRPVPATVAELASLQEGGLVPGQWRRRPVELTTYRVEAQLLAAFPEDDGDWHLVLADPGNPGVTMIAEIANPECSGACRSGLGEQFAMARQTLEAHLRVLPARVEVVGVGFFDHIHGQRGVAPNGIELHPVLNIRFKE